MYFQVSNQRPLKDNGHEKQLLKFSGQFLQVDKLHITWQVVINIPKTCFSCNRHCLCQLKVEFLQFNGTPNEIRCPSTSSKPQLQREILINPVPSMSPGARTPLSMNGKDLESTHFERVCLCPLTDANKETYSRGWRRPPSYSGVTQLLSQAGTWKTAGQKVGQNLSLW